MYCLRIQGETELRDRTGFSVPGPPVAAILWQVARMMEAGFFKSHYFQEFCTIGIFGDLAPAFSEPVATAAFRLE